MQSVQVPGFVQPTSTHCWHAGDSLLLGEVKQEGGHLGARKSTTESRTDFKHCEFQYIPFLFFTKTQTHVIDDALRNKAIHFRTAVESKRIKLYCALENAITSKC